MSGILTQAVDRPTDDLVIDRGANALSVHALKARMQTILDVMANVLEEGKDYGKIPGTDKPTLYKPGAEKLMLTFQLAASQPHTEDLSTDDEIRYRVQVPIVGPDGRVLAVGIGEASTNEEKYRWRKPVCDEEFAETPGHLRREKWFKGQSKPYKGKQIRTSPSDLANTVLKMAHKRGFIHGTLLATASSSVFNQDLEDFTKELRDSIIDEEQERTPPIQPPQRKSESAKSKDNADLKVSPPVTITSVDKPEGKKAFAIKVVGDPRFFSTFDEVVAMDLVKLKGTEQKVCLKFVERQVQGSDKVFLNVSGFTLVAAPAADATREPGAEG